MRLTINLIPRNRLSTILPLAQQLNPDISDDILTTRLNEMIAQGYQCAGLFIDNKLAGICGFWIVTKFYVGKHIEPDNVYISPEHRRQGYGKQLLDWVLDYGKNQGCIASELNCYIANETGNAFWQAQGFNKIGYHYQKTFIDYIEN
jgi:GNAT superfamily N-acetyltransferase